MACEARLYTTVTTNNGRTKLQQGLNTLSLPAGTKIRYDVVTASGGVQKSDKFYFEVISINYNYINQFIKGKFANASNDKIQEWNTDFDKFSDEVLSQMNESKMVVINTLQFHNTNSSGRYIGNYTVPSSLDNKLFTINFYYGYSASAEAGTKSKAKEGLIKDILRVAAFATIPISGLAAGGLFVAEVGAEGLYAYAQAKGNAPAGKNKHGCDFPGGTVIAQTYEINPPEVADLEPENGDDNGNPLIINEVVQINPLIIAGGALGLFYIIGRIF